MQNTLDTAPPLQARRSFRDKVTLAALITSTAGALALIAAPVANAASITYAHNAQLSQFQVRDSGLRANINGGVSAPEPFSADGASVQAALETYRPAPGYQTLSFAYTGGTARLNHENYSNAHSKCWWEWPWSGGHDIGKLSTTCSFTY